MLNILFLISALFLFNFETVKGSGHAEDGIFEMDMGEDPKKGKTFYVSSRDTSDNESEDESKDSSDDEYRENSTQLFESSPPIPIIKPSSLNASSSLTFRPTFKNTSFKKLLLSDVPAKWDGEIENYLRPALKVYNYAPLEEAFKSFTGSLLIAQNLTENNRVQLTKYVEAVYKKIENCNNPLTVISILDDLR